MRLLLVFFMAAGLYAKDVILTWQDAVNPAGTTYSIFRITGTCLGAPLTPRIASGIMAKTYTDSNVPPGTYCYAATAVLGADESVQSNQAAATITAPPAAPTQFTVVVK